MNAPICPHGENSSREEAVWCVAQTKPNAEGTAERNLVRQGFDVFAPRVAHTGRHRGRFREQVKSLFPGYLFVCIPSTLERWRAISSTLGVARLVAFGNDGPARVPRDLIELLRRRCHAGHSPSADGLMEGDAVRIAAGPFADFVGTIESIPSDRRIWILLDILGQERRISIDFRDLEPICC